MCMYDVTESCPNLGDNIRHEYQIKVFSLDD